ncbi:hypothetical protein OIO89_01110 (plasmid) [Mycobacterium ulcerans]|nr:hypothetical protein OIO89_01110 [Mycobacterium ulcerans]
MRLPYAFTGISLHATHATRLRVRLTRTGADAITVHTSDTTGAPVAIIDSLITAPSPPPGSAPATTAAGLLHLSWPPHPDTTTDTDTTADTDALRYRVIAEPLNNYPATCTTYTPAPTCTPAPPKQTWLCGRYGSPATKSSRHPSIRHRGVFSDTP